MAVESISEEQKEALVSMGYQEYVGFSALISMASKAQAALRREIFNYMIANWEYYSDEQSNLAKSDVDIIPVHGGEFTTVRKCCFNPHPFEDYSYPSVSLNLDQAMATNLGIRDHPPSPRQREPRPHDSLRSVPSYRRMEGGTRRHTGSRTY